MMAHADGWVVVRFSSGGLPSFGHGHPAPTGRRLCIVCGGQMMADGVEKIMRRRVRHEIRPYVVLTSSDSIIFILTDRLIG